VNDFRDGNLLFEIMDKKVWGKASSDIVGLKKFHAGKKDKYKWQASVYAFTFTFQQKEDAEAARKAYTSGMDIEALKKVYVNNGFADSGRYEAGELMGVGRDNAKEGFVSEIYSNVSDGSSSFHIITKKYADPSVKSFEEAKASVINDYQQYLEDIWIATLKKKYPVTINQINWQKLMDRTL
jgi:peptidyl-prolyl cis-trans isomerase SurA